MSNVSDIDILVTALTAVSARSGQTVPEYDNPLPPYYSLLVQSKPLTLRDILAQKVLLRDYDDAARAQLYEVQKVMKACWQLPPTPLTEIPLGF